MLFSQFNLCLINLLSNFKTDFSKSDMKIITEYSNIEWSPQPLQIGNFYLHMIQTSKSMILLTYLDSNGWS